MFCLFTCISGAQPVKCSNYQEIKIQEQVQKLAMGTIPRSMWVVLEDDLVDCCKAGDDVTIWLVTFLTCRESTFELTLGVQKLALSTIPRSMWVVLEDNLVYCCKADDDVMYLVDNTFNELGIYIWADLYTVKKDFTPYLWHWYNVR